MAPDIAEEHRQLRRMRAASLLEGSTLLLLVVVAVPLKHLAGMAAATAVMGPIHGLAFLVYVWMLIQTVSGGGWSRSETIRLAIAAFRQNFQLDLIFVEVELLECRVDCVVYGGTAGLNACHVSSPCPGQVAVGVLRL